MNGLLRKRFSSRIGVVVGQSSSDADGARLLKQVRKAVPDAELFGVGGDKMKAVNGFQAFGDVSQLRNRAFFPSFNFQHDWRSPLWVWLWRAKVEAMWFSRKLESEGFWKNLEQGQVDMILADGNKVLSTRIFSEAEKRSEVAGVVKPITVQLTGARYGYGFEHVGQVDLLMHSLPMGTGTVNHFDFPSVFVGKEAVFDALSFIYRQQPQASFSLTPNTLRLVPDENLLTVEKTSFEVRRRFREKHFIPESCHLFYVAPGEADEEIIANLEVASAGIQELVKRATQDNRFTAQNFGVVVALPNGKQHLEARIGGLAKSGIFTKVISGNSNDERFSAICACDYGAAAEGDWIFEAVTLQLPTVVLDPSPFFTAYFKLMYNVHATEINWLGEMLYPEMTGQSFGAKLAELWQEWFMKPKSRFRLASRANKFIFDLLPREVPLSPHSLGFSDTGREATFINPAHVKQQTIKRLAQEFAQLKGSNTSLTQLKTQHRKLTLGF